MAVVASESSKWWAIADAAQSGFEFSEAPAGISSSVGSGCSYITIAFENTCYLVASIAAYLIGAIVSVALEVIVCTGTISLAFYCLLRRGDSEFQQHQGVEQKGNFEWLQEMCQLTCELFGSLTTYFDGDASGLVNATRVVVS